MQQFDQCCVLILVVGEDDGLVVVFVVLGVGVGNQGVVGVVVGEVGNDFFGKVVVVVLLVVVFLFSKVWVDVGGGFFDDGLGENVCQYQFLWVDLIEDVLRKEFFQQVLLVFVGVGGCGGQFQQVQFGYCVVQVFD